MRRTKPLRFSATKSETGDLLFAEIEGREDHIFVGQPMNLKLQIWLRPYSNSQLNLTLSEPDMWQMISFDKSNWGIFADRLNEMSANDERPVGREVLRRDSEGIDRRYYLYEIDATVYPKRPGQIDGDEVQIVVDYPTQLGKSRDPFDSFFNDDSFFGGRLPSLFRDEMPSMFGLRLRVTESRPIVASAGVNATDVRPIPTTDRPADYRGAVGRYRMVVQASPNEVKAGDPITLHLGIQGDGPMDLVQAPPLAEIPDLVRDFKVADEPLAGIVKDDVKMFTPRREDINEIPPIPFSFFDPSTEEFVTIKSEPIAITVAAADQLVLDSIVGKSNFSANTNEGEHGSATPSLNLGNYSGESVLKSTDYSGAKQLLLVGFIVPPLVFLAAMAARYRRSFARNWPKRANDAKPTITLIRDADSAGEIAQALLRFVASRLNTDESMVTTNTARNLLETKVAESTLAELIDVLQRCEQASYAGLTRVDLTTLRNDALKCVAELSQTLPQLRQRRNRRKEMNQPSGNVATTGKKSAAAATMLVLMFSLFFNDSQASAIELTASQRSTILAEATTAYERASSIGDSDSAESKQSFALAARKYQNARRLAKSRNAERTRLVESK